MPENTQVKPGDIVNVAVNLDGEQTVRYAIVLATVTGEEHEGEDGEPSLTVAYMNSRSNFLSGIDWHRALTRTSPVRHVTHDEVENQQVGMFWMDVLPDAKDFSPDGTLQQAQLPASASNPEGPTTTTHTTTMVDAYQQKSSIVEGKPETAVSSAESDHGDQAQVPTTTDAGNTQSYEATSAPSANDTKGGLVPEEGGSVFTPPSQLGQAGVSVDAGDEGVKDHPVVGAVQVGEDPEGSPENTIAPDPVPDTRTLTAVQLDNPGVTFPTLENKTSDGAEVPDEEKAAPGKKKQSA